MTFEEHYHEVVELLEGVFVHIFNGLRDRFADEIAVVRAQYPAEEFRVPKDGKVLRLSFKEGISMLGENGYDVPDLEDLNTEMEKALGRLVAEKYGEEFYILDKFPLAVSSPPPNQRASCVVNIGVGKAILHNARSRGSQLFEFV